jgi:hypothetical protein
MITTLFLGFAALMAAVVVALSARYLNGRTAFAIKGLKRGQSTILDTFSLSPVFITISRWLFPVPVSVLTAGLHSPHFSFEAVLRSTLRINDPTTGAAY